MDPTSYPPPPSVPEPPVPGTPPAPPVPDAPAAPQAAQYAPPPPDSMPPNYVAPASPPPKKNKTLVIVLVILGLLLLCCGAGVVGAFTIFSTQSEVTTGTPTDVETPDVPAVTEEDAPADTGTPGERAEWTEFQPELADPSIYAEPTAAQAALIEEIHAKLYPGFTIEDTLAEPGREDAENYYPDMLYVKASLASDPSVRIAYYLWTDSAASLAAGVHLDESDTEEYETVATASSGASYIYDHENLMDLMEGTLDDRVVEVLAQAEQDFPGYVAVIAGEDGDDTGVVLTRWNAFPDLELGLVVMYTPDGDGWAVSSVSDW